MQWAWMEMILHSFHNREMKNVIENVASNIYGAWIWFCRAFCEWLIFFRSLFIHLLLLLPLIVSFNFNRKQQIYLHSLSRSVANPIESPFKQKQRNDEMLEYTALVNTTTLHTSLQYTCTFCHVKHEYCTLFALYFDTFAAVPLFICLFASFFSFLLCFIIK